MIDVNFDFTSDSYGYWDGFWDRNEGLGYGGSDPDNASPTLQEYHRLLWSKQLPNGQKMELVKGIGPTYLTWNDFRFGSDAFIVSFRYKRYRYMMDEVEKKVTDFRKYYEDMIRRAYTIGGMIIFPKHHNSINQNRGTNKQVSDRWDLTMECIRRYYAGEESPLTEILESDKAFFNLFVDFKGYVDFFLLQDCVSEDYSSVDVWDGKGDFSEDGLPKTIDDYFHFIDKEFEFMDKRNQRIAQYCKENNL